MVEAGFKSLLNLAKTNSQRKIRESSYFNPDAVHEHNASIEKTKTWVNEALHKKLLKAENQGRSIPYHLVNQIHDEQQFDLVEFFLKMNRVLELLPKNLHPYCMKSRI